MLTSSKRQIPAVFIQSFHSTAKGCFGKTEIQAVMIIFLEKKRIPLGGWGLLQQTTSFFVKIISFLGLKVSFLSVPCLQILCGLF